MRVAGHAEVMQGQLHVRRAHRQGHNRWAPNISMFKKNPFYLSAGG